MLPVVLVVLVVLLLAGGTAAIEDATVADELPPIDRQDTGPLTAEEYGPPVSLAPFNQPGGVTMDSEQEALGRVITSEVGSSKYSDEEKTAVAWCVRNRAAQRGCTIYYMEHDQPGGWAAQRGGNPPFSSAQPATAYNLGIAAAVLAADRSQDPTGGATSFFEPAQQDICKRYGDLYRADPIANAKYERFQYYRRDAASVRAKWAAGGSVQLATVGRIELWRA